MSVVFLEDGPMVAKARVLGVDAVVVEAGRLRDVHYFPKVVRTLAAQARRHDADAIVSWMTRAHLYAAIASARACVPAIWYQHRVPDPSDILTRLATLLPAAGILACSPTIANAQEQLWPRRPAVSVPPCVDLDRFDPDLLPTPKNARHFLGLTADGPLVGMVARMQRWKGVHVFVQAMAAVLESHPDAHGVIVGGRHDLEPDYPDVVQQQIDDLNLTDRVTWVGFQSNVPLWMQALDIVVHASDQEPFGMVIIEAMALGKPVVAGAEGGPREIVTAGVNGLLASYGDARAVAMSIQRYLDNHDYAARVGAAAQRRAQDFSSEYYSDRFTSAVASLLPARMPSVTQL